MIAEEDDDVGGTGEEGYAEEIGVSPSAALLSIVSSAASRQHKEGSAKVEKNAGFVARSTVDMEIVFYLKELMESFVDAASNVVAPQRSTLSDKLADSLVTLLPHSIIALASRVYEVPLASSLYGLLRSMIILLYSVVGQSSMIEEAGHEASVGVENIDLVSKSQREILTEVEAVLQTLAEDICMWTKNFSEEMLVSSLKCALSFPVEVMSLTTATKLFDRALKLGNSCT